MGEPPLDVVQGTLDLLIPRTLAWRPAHRYGISRWIRQQTEETLHIQDAALHHALRRLERRGWVEAEWAVTESNRRARCYRLTEEGRRRLTAETSAGTHYAAAVARVLEPVPGEVR